jgi:thioredoxin-like negative regulator of GroEL
MLATIHLGLDEPERARLDLEAAESLTPDAPMLWAVWAQYHLTRSDPIAAAGNMKRAVELDPDNWQLRLQAAHIFQGAGDDEAAIEHVGAALRLVPPDKRPEVRRLAEQMMGSGALGADPNPDLPDPALMLGDPSNLRLREPGQDLKLDLDE